MRFFSVRFPTFLFPVLLIFLPSAVSASVVINEVLFDPVNGDNGDTGLEWVELYNNAAENAALSGWQLYPDGAGYFAFPAGFNLPGKGFVVIHLRASGTDGAKNLYHPSAGANMGNSSGSIALFSGEPRGKDTIKAFMRYQKLGAGERKTWEPAAAEAGLWQAGTYTDISNFTEGDALGLIADGVTTGFSTAWEVYKIPSPASSNTGVQSSDIPNGGEKVAVAPPSNTTPNYIIPRLEVEILTNGSAIAGASHYFHGRAFGKLGSMMSGALVRYLWNFGDGSLAEGASIAHTYRIPGVYAVSLNVNSGAALGSAYFDVTVRENPVKIERVRVGDDGFIVLKNSSDNSFDLTGWILKDSAGNSFTIPEDTRLSAERILTLPNEITGLTLNAYPFTLHYGNLKVADSWVAENHKVLSNAIPLKADVSSAVNSPPSVAGDRTDQMAVIEDKTTILRENPSPLDAKSAPHQGTREFWFLGFAAGLAVAGGGAAVFLRRKFIANV